MGWEGAQKDLVWSMRRCTGLKRTCRMVKAQERMNDTLVGRKFKTAASGQDLEVWKNTQTTGQDPSIPQQEPIKWTDQSSQSCCRGQQKSQGHPKGLVQSDNFKKFRKNVEVFYDSKTKSIWVCR